MLQHYEYFNITESVKVIELKGCRPRAKERLREPVYGDSKV
jgi:hypothetical protein